MNENESIDKSINKLSMHCSLFILLLPKCSISIDADRARINNDIR